VVPIMISLIEGCG